MKQNPKKVSCSLLRCTYSLIVISTGCISLISSGTFLTKAKVPQTAESTAAPKQEEHPSHLSFFEEQISLLREIRDYLKEQQNHE